MTSPEQESAPELRLLDPSDKRLHTVASPVPVETISSPEIQKIVDSMLEISKGNRDVGAGLIYMVGLAATQLGIMKRVIVVDTDIVTGRIPSEQEKVRGLKAFINPQIIEQSEEKVWEREGCFSFGVQKGVFGALPRNRQIKIGYYDREGQPQEYVAEDFVARIFQHEIDHLNGIEYYQRLPAGHKLHLVKPEEATDYRNGGWANWQRTVEPHDVLTGKIEVNDES